MVLQLLNSDLERKEIEELFINSLDIYFREHLGIDPSQLSDESLKLLIPKNLIIDQTYIANWSIPDYEQIVKPLIKKMNTDRLSPAEFQNYLKRIYQDQSVVIDRDTILEPISIGRKADRMTFEGVRAMLLNIMGQYQPAFRFAEMGDGVGLAHYGREFLVNPVTARVEISQITNGSMILRGETLFVTASFNSGTPSFKQREFGLYDSIDPADDRMFFYVLIDTQDQKDHTINNDVPTVSSSVNVCTL